MSQVLCFPRAQTQISSGVRYQDVFDSAIDLFCGGLFQRKASKTDRFTNEKANYNPKPKVERSGRIAVSRGAAKPTRRPLTAFHKVLGLIELLELIFAHINNPRAYAHAARVCRLWYEPAMKELWKHLPASESVERVLSKQISRRAVMLTQEGSLGQWDDRFDQNAKRTRTLKIEATSALAQFIPKPLSTSPRLLLFPALQSLEFRFSEFSETPLLNTLLSPSLSQIRVVYAGWSEGKRMRIGFRNLFKCLEKASNLQELRLADCLLFQCGADVEELLWNSPKLRTLMFDTTPDEVISFVRRFSATPYISEICVGNHQGALERLERSHPAETPMEANQPGLTTFRAVLKHIPDMQQLLDFDSFRQLKTLQLDLFIFGNIVGSERACALFSIIPTTCPMLESLNVSIDDISDTVDVDFLTIRPVIQHLRLRTFIVSFPHHVFNLSLEEITEMAITLGPSIEVLSLNVSGISRWNHPHIGFEALIPIAEHCPHVRELGIHISPPSYAELPPVSHKFGAGLEVVRFGGPLTLNSNFVAQFLNAMLSPHTKLEFDHGVAREETSDGWKKVRGALKSLRQADRLARRARNMPTEGRLAADIRRMNCSAY